MSNRSYNQLCGLAYALDIVGERWTLLIIRELFPGPRRFTDLMDGLPGISTNLLTGRLKNLEEQGIICRRVLPPPAASTVYELTPLGRGLEDALVELGKWGSQFVPFSPTDDAVLHLGSYALTLKTFFEAEQAQDIDETYEVHVGGEILQVHVQAGEIEVRQGQAQDPDLVLHADIMTYLGLLQGHIEPQEALAQNLIRIEGEPQTLQRFLDLCGIPAPA
ncbi:MAG TPA: winged helix-turn-helix transcriptional regulator [Candidatus Sulfomarinibacteraceae bacterium]|nr:winged helix-turn-helix transcriptional regulator [Candidatus Sulfomarinibacteraceae bacterium]